MQLSCDLILGEIMLRRYSSLLLILFAVLNATLALSQGKVRIVVSVDWEGRTLEPENLLAMQDFRAAFPEVPLQHFLNAAYYTKDDADPSSITSEVRSVLRPGDEHGLHIHAWRSLVLASGVKFRRGPSFVAGNVNEERCGIDCGSDVALTAYSTRELRKIIQKSVTVLTAQGFDRPYSFRAGGWQADSKVLTALAEEGFTMDGSATDGNYLEESWGDYNLYPFVKQLWPTMTPSSQPYTFTTASQKSILELPNNGSLADYVDASDMLTAFKVQAGLLQENPNQDVYLSIGFHQETAASYLPRLIGALKNIRVYAQTQGIPYVYNVGPFPVKL